MKKLITILFVVGFFLSTSSFAQKDAQAVWFCIIDSLTSSVSGDIEAPAQKLTGGLTVETYRETPYGIVQRIWYHGEAWPVETAPDFNKYIEFSMSPKPGNTLTVTEVQYNFGCYGTREHFFANAYWDTDPTFFTKQILDTTSRFLNDVRDSALVVHNYKINANVKDGGTFYVRIFPWYDTGSGVTKWVCITDVIIIGKTSPAVGVEQEAIPTEFTLKQNYPNPFNPTTNIEFAIPKEGNYTLKVFNLLGQEVLTLIDNQLSPGNHFVNFDASKLTSGMYIYQLSGNNVNLSRKMLLMK